MPQGSLTIISGPSGAGKGTLVASLRSSDPKVWVSTSVTTRPPREGEVADVDYHFYTKKQFEDLIAQDGFLEWAQVHDEYYGTLQSEVEDAVSSGKSVILEIDVQGARQVLEKKPEAHSIFIAPPSMEVLEERLRKRGTEDETRIARRLKNAVMELSAKEEYDYTIVNDDLETAADQLQSLVASFNS